jgi:hypothetical protein
VNRPHELGSPHHGIPFELYDAFAARRFGGNVAGVVISQTAISPALMQNIASELGAPTTGFAHVRARQPVSIRFFTPRQEIGACGHATVATALVSADASPDRLPGLCAGPDRECPHSADLDRDGLQRSPATGSACSSGVTPTVKRPYRRGRRPGCAA